MESTPLKDQPSNFGLFVLPRKNQRGPLRKPSPGCRPARLDGNLFLKTAHPIEKKRVKGAKEKQTSLRQYIKEMETDPIEDDTAGQAAETVPPTPPSAFVQVTLHLLIVLAIN